MAGKRAGGRWAGHPQAAFIITTEWSFRCLSSHPQAAEAPPAQVPVSPAVSSLFQGHSRTKLEHPALTITFYSKTLASGVTTYLSAGKPCQATALQPLTHTSSEAMATMKLCRGVLLMLALRSASANIAHQRYFVDRSLSHLQMSADQVWTRLLAYHPAPETVTVVEVGVYDGKQCAEAASFGFGKVICFEPSPKSFNNSKIHLEKSRTAKWRDVQVLQLAAGPKSNETLQFNSLGGTGDHAGPRYEGEIPQYINHTINVSSIALDDYFKSSSVYLMKIDTQGFDGMVLKGMMRMLYENRVQYIIMEVWPKSMLRTLSCEETLTMAINAGYTIHELTVGAINSEQPKPTDWHSHPTHVKQFCQWYLNLPSVFGVWTDVLLSLPTTNQRR